MVRVNCPVCGSQFAVEQSLVPPFCSDRCQQMDLGRWLNEQYSISRISDFDEDIDLELRDVDSGEAAERTI